MPYLMGNQVDATWNWTSTSSSGRCYGIRFQVTATCNLIRIGCYKAGSDPSPRKLQFWNPTPSKLYETGSFPLSGGATGWRWFTPSLPLALTPGVTYTVSMDHAGLDNLPQQNSLATRATPPAPFLHDDAASFVVGNEGTYPSSAQTTPYYGLSVEVDYVVPPPPGPGEGDPTTTGDLNSWLSSDPDVQTHETDGLPWLTRAAVNSSRTVLDALAGAVTNIGNAIGNVGDAASSVGSLMARVAEILARIPVNILNSIKLTGEWLLSWFGTGAKPAGAPTIPEALDVIASMLEDQQQLVGNLWHRTETSNWLTAVPGADWVLQDTLEWSGPVGWNQPADCYVFHITAYPDYWDQEDIGGFLRLRNAAWWMPLTGTFPHERHSADMEFQVLHVLPMRCEGILLRPYANFSGTLEAWMRPEALPGLPLPPIP